MSIRRLVLLPAAVVVLTATAPASAIVSLPTVKRTVTAGAGNCATTSYTARMAGFLTTRLGAASGDWDLSLKDARSGQALSASRSFGATEVAQSWADAGQRFAVRACRISGSADSAAVTIDFADAVKPPATRSSIIRIPRVSQAMFDRLTEAGFDLEELSITEKEMDVFIESPAMLEKFKRFGIPFTTRVADLQALDRRNRAAEAARTAAGVEGAVPSGRTSYRTLSGIQAEMKEILDENKAIARPITVGRTVQGRSIDGIEFSDNVNAADDGKPTFFLMAVHHAREWPSAEIAMEYMHQLVNSFGQADADGVRVTNILRNARIVVVPVLNQDGYVSSRGDTGVPTAPDPSDSGNSLLYTPEALTGTFAYRRKNCNSAVANPVASAQQNQSLPCYYQTGVDNNRNYGFSWGGRGAGSDPFGQTYRGTGPWSEPENQAVWRTSQNRPVTVMVTMHTIAAMVLRSPGLKSAGLSPDETLLKELGDRIGSNTGYRSMYGWELYDTTGTTEDWNYGAAGTLGYTIEIGPSGGVFHGNYKIAVEDQWNGPKPDKRKKITGGGMKDSLLTAAEYAFNPKTHSIISGTGTPGATLVVKKTFTTNSWPVCTFAQGYLASAPAPLDCAGEGTTGTIKTPDELVYTTKVRPDGTFTWHITQSTRPFEGYKYNATTKLPEPNGTKEKWTLTCDGGSSQQFEIERGDKLDLGNVCA